MSCANTLTRSAAINGNDRMSCPGREEHTDPLSSIDRKTPPALIATLHIQPGRLVCLSCHSGQGKHLAGAQALTGGSQRNSAGFRRSDLPAGSSAMQRGQSLPWRAPSKACGPAPNLASPQHPEGFLGSPPSEFSSSPLPSADYLFLTSTFAASRFSIPGFRKILISQPKLGWTSPPSRAMVSSTKGGWYALPYPAGDKATAGLCWWQRVLSKA